MEVVDTLFFFLQGGVEVKCMVLYLHFIFSFGALEMRVLFLLSLFFSFHDDCIVFWRREVANSVMLVGGCERGF